MEVYGPLYVGYASISRQNLREKPIVNTAVYHVLSIWKKIHTFRGKILQLSFTWVSIFYALQRYAFERFICVFNKYVIPNNTKLLNRVFGKQTKDMQKVLSTNIDYEYYTHYFSQELVPIYLLLYNIKCSEIQHFWDDWKVWLIK